MTEYIIPEKDYYTLPENCDFDAVIHGGFGRAGWGTLNSNSCTPDLKFGQVGLAINAPTELVYPNGDPNSRIKGDALPVTGTLVHEVNNRLDLGDFKESIVFVMVDSKAPYIGYGNIPPNPNAYIQEPIKKALPQKGLKVGGFFTINLLKICHMSLRETEYIVYATLGPYKSNVVTISVTKRK